MPVVRPLQCIVSGGGPPCYQKKNAQVAEFARLRWCLRPHLHMCVCVCVWVWVHAWLCVCVCLSVRMVHTGLRYTPPPLVLPHPLSFPKGGALPLAQPKIFRCSSLCCCGKTTTQECCPKHSRVLPKVESEHVQEFKVKWSRTKTIYTELVKE